eukprot:13998107-Alexandrium_andersonii.AAC.1
MARLHHDSPLEAVGGPPPSAPRTRPEPLGPLVRVLKTPQGAIQARHPSAYRAGSGQGRVLYPTRPVETLDPSGANALSKLGRARKPPCLPCRDGRRPCRRNRAAWRGPEFPHRSKPREQGRRDPGRAGKAAAESRPQLTRHCTVRGSDVGGIQSARDDVPVPMGRAEGRRPAQRGQSDRPCCNRPEGLSPRALNGGCEHGRGPLRGRCPRRIEGGRTGTKVGPLRDDRRSPKRREGQGGGPGLHAPTGDHRRL